MKSLKSAKLHAGRKSATYFILTSSHRGPPAYMHPVNALQESLQHQVHQLYSYNDDIYELRPAFEKRPKVFQTLQVMHMYGYLFILLYSSSLSAGLTN